MSLISVHIFMDSSQTILSGEITPVALPTLVSVHSRLLWLIPYKA